MRSRAVSLRACAGHRSALATADARALTAIFKLLQDIFHGQASINGDQSDPVWISASRAPRV